MKKFILFASLLGLFAYGCNKGEDQAGATGSGAGIEREEVRDGQSPGFEKEEFREKYDDSDANITTPIDSRPDLEEEE